MPPSQDMLSGLIPALTPAIFEAGQLIMKIHGQKVIARTKKDGSPVSEADEGAEAILLPAIKAAAPDITIISEENAASHSLTAPETFFLVDPLDGTKEFLKEDGKGSFTVNIGLIHKNAPVMGIVYAPALDALYWGVANEGAFMQKGAVKTALKAPRIPSENAIAVASASHRDEVTNQWLATHKIDKTISIGSSLKFCLIAEGAAHLYPRFSPTMEWDTAAGDAVLRAAGGMVRTPEGDAFSYGKAGYLNGAFIAYGCET